MEFKNQKRENKGNEQKVRWRLQPEGLLNLPEKSDEILHNGVQREHGTTQEVYDIWENKVHKIMDECFKRVRNNVETNRQTGGQIQMLARSINMFAKKGKAQRRVAKLYIQALNEVQIEKVAKMRAEKLHKVVSEMTIDGHFNTPKYWKLRKAFNRKHQNLSLIHI